MTTRTYCDNCGNTVRNPHKYAFGNRSNFTQAATIACPQCGYCGHIIGHPGHQHSNVVSGGVQGAGGVGSGGAGGGLTPYYPAQQPAGPADFIVIDLCDRCRPIWMNRVKALTEASEPGA